MTNLSREQRIESYRAASQEADCLARSNQTERSLVLLRQQEQLAAEAGDEDYRGFFEAETINLTLPDYPRQIALVTAAVDWAAQSGLPADHFLLRAIGIYHVLQGDLDGAIVWFDKALAENPKDWVAMRQKGVSLSCKGDEDGAIVWFDKSLAENPKDWNAMRNKGVALSNKGDEDGAIVWFDKSLAGNPKDWDAMRQKGVSLSKKGDLDGAIVWLDKALAENGRDDLAYVWSSLAEYARGNHNAAFQKIGEALKLDRDRWIGQFQGLCKVMGRNPQEELRKILPEPDEAAGELPSSPHALIKQLGPFIQTVREKLGPDVNRYLERMEKEQARLEQFLEPRSWLEPNQSLLLVLRKWNSYTPAIPSDDEERSRGGGYFLWHNGYGTVIDPGFNFLENFDEAKCRIHDIHNVILTHAHNDHTAEFETLRMLLQKYGEACNNAGQQAKKVRFFLNNGSFQKFSGLLNLQDFSFTEKVITLNPGAEHELLGGGRIRVMPAYHDEVVARDQAVGLLVTLDMEGGSTRRILLTSDTGLLPLDKGTRELRADGTQATQQIWRRYEEYGATKPDVMIIHIGSIKRQELEYNLDREPWQACYPNHLGLIGTAQVMLACRPKLALISEFGEEMRNIRLSLVKSLQEKLLDVIYDDPQPYIPRAAPADLALIYDLNQEKFWDCVSGNWAPMAEIDFEEGKRVDPDGIYYFAKANRQKYDREPARYVSMFRATRLNRNRMYFHEEAD